MRLHLWLVVGLLAGCEAELVAPAGAVILCRDSSECPKGSECRPAVGRCFRADADRTPPGLSSSDVPAVGGLAGFELSLTASEPLAFPPSVDAVLPSGTRPLAFVEGTGERYRFRFTATEADRAADAVSFVAQLVDTDGNEATGVRVGQVPLDFTPPALDLATPPPARATVGKLTFTVGSSEPLAALPDVTVGGKPAAVTAGASPLRFDCAFEVTATSNDGTVVVVGKDLAGNASQRAFPSVVAFDFAPPAVAARAVDTPRVRSGQTAVARLTASEALAKDPIVTAVGPGGATRTLLVGQRAGLEYTYVYRVVATDPDGAYEVRVGPLEDLAGNTSAAEVLGSFATDATAPSVTSAELFPAGRSLYFKAGETLTFDLVASEDLGPAPRAWLGSTRGSPFTCTANPATSLTRFRCASKAPLAKATDPEGAVTIAIQVEDPAGNTGYGSLPVIVDFTDPSVVPGSAHVALASPTPLVNEVTAVTDGTRLQVTFTATEALASDPTVTTSVEAQTFKLANRSGNTYAYTLTFAPNAAGHAPGPFEVRLGLTDLAGNTPPDATLVLPADESKVLTVKNPPARTPATGVAGAVVYERAPWGSNGSPATFTVTGKAASVDALARLVVLDGADAATASRIGRGAAGADGAFGPIELDRLDRQTVFLVAIDEAGNASPVVEVKDGRFVASLGGKVPGSQFENPTVLARAPVFRPSLDQPALVEAAAADLAAVSIAGGDALTVAGEASWAARNPPVPTPLMLPQNANPPAVFAWDNLRGKVTGLANLFGTISVVDFDGNAFTPRTTTGTPPLCCRDLARDPVRRRMYAFGDWDQALGANVDTLWELDEQTMRWADVTPTPRPASWPSARGYQRLAWDPVRGTVLMYGGLTMNPFKYIDELWELDPETRTWTQIPKNPSTATPQTSMAGVAYDVSRSKLVVFGASAVWEWDSATALWSKRTTNQAPPGCATQMVFDEARDVAVCYGGNILTNVDADTLWEWDAKTGDFADRTPSPRPAGWPLASHWVPMAWDGAAKRIYFWTHRDPAKPGEVRDAWAWDGAKGVLTPRARAGVWPPVTTSHAVAYDERRHRTVEWGGFTSTGGGFNYSGDTWEHDAETNTWVRYPAVSNTPTTRTQHAMAWDPARQRVVMFGGSSAGIVDDLWEWDGDTGQWVSRTPSPRPAAWPSARLNPGLVTDHASGRVLMFGGQNVADVWAWDGTAGQWTNLTPSPTPSSWPATRIQFAAAFDEARTAGVLFGGTFDPATPADVFSVAGATAVATQYPTSGLGNLHAAGMTWLAPRGRVLMHGGNVFQGSSTDESWEWTGSAFVKRSPSGVRPPRRTSSLHTLTFDPDRQVGVLFGGGDTAQAYNDVWEWHGGDADRPAALWRVPLDLARLPLGGVSALEATVVAGGEGASGAAAASGAILYAWNARQSRWEELARTASATPTALEAAGNPGKPVPLPGGASAWMEAPQHTVTLAVAPIANGGAAADLARVSVDGLELAMTYRRP